MDLESAEEFVVKYVREDYVDLKICGNCKNHYMYGVMGFDGQSFLCKVREGEKDPFDSCEDFDRRVCIY